MAKCKALTGSAVKRLIFAKLQDYRSAIASYEPREVENRFDPFPGWVAQKAPKPGFSFIMLVLFE